MAKIKKTFAIDEEVSKSLTFNATKLRMTNDEIVEIAIKRFLNLK